VRLGGTMTGAGTSLRPRRRLVAAVVVAVVGAGVMQAAVARGPVTGPKNYLPSASPTVVPLPLPDPDTATVSIQLANCGVCDGFRSSTQSFGSAQVRFPSTAPLDASHVLLSRTTGWSVASSSDATSGLTTLQIGNTGIGTTLAVQPGEAITLTIPVVSTATATQIQFATQVKQSNDFSGSGNDFLPAGADPLVYIGSGPATHLQFGVQPTTIQGANQPTTTSTTPVLTTCATVRAFDALGNLATSFTGSVALTPSDPALGLQFDGGTAATNAVAGVATFGTGSDCIGGLSATKLGFGYTLTASSTGVTSDVSSPFDVLQFYAKCAASCGTPTFKGPNGTSGSAQAQGTGTNNLTFDVGRHDWLYNTKTCNPDVGAATFNPYRDAVTIDLNAHSKTVTLLWSKQAVQWAINNGASQWRVCVAVTFPFLGADGTAQSGGDGFFVGALLPCGTAGLAADSPCLLKLNKSGGQQQAVVSLPLHDGDPKAF